MNMTDFKQDHIGEPTIHVDQLIQYGACETMVRIFTENFGESVVVTVERAEQVAELFPWAWAADYLLSVKGRKEFYEIYDSARIEYVRLSLKHGPPVAYSELERKYAEAFAWIYIAEWEYERQPLEVRP